jgi:hypothetical protein
MENMPDWRNFSPQEVGAMRRWLLPALALVVLLGVNPVAADDAFYLVPMGAVGTKITRLPYVISLPGFYYLGGDLTADGSGVNGIIVTANFVTIDLMGFSLIHTGDPASSYGIWILGCNNVEIRGGTVRGFYSGIEESLSTGYCHRVLNMRVANNSYNGIMLNGNGHMIKNCSATENTWGIVINGTGIISKCISNNNRDTGIKLGGAGNCMGNNACNNLLRNYYLGEYGQYTPLLATQNSAAGSSLNYYIPDQSTGVVRKDNVP